MQTIRDLISKWPSAEVFADDIGLKWRSHGRVMKYRGRIPRGHWPAVVQAAASRKIPGITIKVLEDAHKERA